MNTLVSFWSLNTSAGTNTTALYYLSQGNNTDLETLKNMNSQYGLAPDTDLI